MYVSRNFLHTDRTVNTKHIKEDFNLKAWVRFFCELKDQKSLFSEYGLIEYQSEGKREYNNV